MPPATSSSVSSSFQSQGRSLHSSSQSSFRVVGSVARGRDDPLWKGVLAVVRLPVQAQTNSVGHVQPKVDHLDLVTRHPRSCLGDGVGDDVAGAIAVVSQGQLSLKALVLGTLEQLSHRFCRLTAAVDDAHVVPLTKSDALPDRLQARFSMGRSLSKTCSGNSYSSTSRVPMGTSRPVCGSNNSSRASRISPGMSPNSCWYLTMSFCSKLLVVSSFGS
jgi:hypothetical protein